jgi:hypothetical protein
MTRSHTGWIVSWFNHISHVCHHTHEHNLYHHTIHKYSVFKTQCVQASQHVRFTRLYFSVLNRFISGEIRMNKWPTVLLRLTRVRNCSSDKFLVINLFVSKSYLNLPPPKSQLLNSFCDWWSRTYPWVSTFPRDITFFTIACLSSLSHMFCFCICVHAAVVIKLPY